MLLCHAKMSSKLATSRNNLHPVREHVTAMIYGSKIGHGRQQVDGLGGGRAVLGRAAAQGPRTQPRQVTTERRPGASLGLDHPLSPPRHARAGQLQTLGQQICPLRRHWTQRCRASCWPSWGQSLGNKTNFVLQQTCLTAPTASGRAKSRT